MCAARQLLPAEVSAELEQKDEDFKHSADNNGRDSGPGESRSTPASIRPEREDDPGSHQRENEGCSSKDTTRSRVSGRSAAVGPSEQRPKEHVSARCAESESERQPGRARVGLAVRLVHRFILAVASESATSLPAALGIASLPRFAARSGSGFLLWMGLEVGLRHEWIDDRVEHSGGVFAVGGLAEHDLQDVQADNDVGQELEVAVRRDLSTQDGAVEYVPEQAARPCEQVVRKRGSQLWVTARGGGQSNQHSHLLSSHFVKVWDGGDDRLEIALESAGVGGDQRNCLFAPGSHGGDDYGCFRRPAPIQRSFSSVRTRRDLVHGEPVVAELG